MLQVIFQLYGAGFFRDVEGGYVLYIRVVPLFLST